MAIRNDDIRQKVINSKRLRGLLAVAVLDAVEPDSISEVEFPRLEDFSPSRPSHITVTFNWEERAVRPACSLGMLMINNDVTDSMKQPIDAIDEVARMVAGDSFVQGVVDDIGGTPYGFHLGSVAECRHATISDKATCKQCRGSGLYCTSNAWRLGNDSLALRIIYQLYEKRNFKEVSSGAMVLADALQDSGCDHAALLDHLRNGRSHFVGCWAMEAIRVGHAAL